MLEHHPELEALLPRHIEHMVEPSENFNHIRIVVEGVPVSITVGVSDIEIIVEGELPDTLAVRVAEEVRANAEAAAQGRCVLEQM